MFGEFWLVREKYINKKFCVVSTTQKNKHTQHILYTMPYTPQHVTDQFGLPGLVIHNPQHLEKCAHCTHWFSPGNGFNVHVMIVRMNTAGLFIYGNAPIQDFCQQCTQWIVSVGTRIAKNKYVIAMDLHLFIRRRPTEQDYIDFYANYEQPEDDEETDYENESDSDDE